MVFSNIETIEDLQKLLQDVKSMVDFAWGDRYQLLLEPLITKKQEVLTF